MRPSPLLRVLNALGDADCKPRKSGTGYSARCPAHDDAKPSLSVGEGDDGRALLTCMAGCAVEDVLAALHLNKADLFPPRARYDQAEIVATYDYTDAAGELLFQVVRQEGHKFFQRRPDGQGGWINKLGKTPRALYRLPAVVEAVAAGRTIFVAEGEKDVDALVAAGQAATCNPMGAGKWRAGHAQVLYGAAGVIVVADADEPGRAHARQVADSLTGHVGKLLIVEAAVGKDAADHLGAGRTIHEFTVTPDGTQPAASALWPSPGDPMAVARRLADELHNHHGGLLTLRHWRGDFQRWRDGCWAEDELAAIRSQLYTVLDAAECVGKDDEAVPWAPNRRKVGDVAEALAAITYLDGKVNPPCWITSAHGKPDPRELVVVGNGILHVPSRRLLDHTPDLFNQVRVPFDYEADALEPTEWLAFLDALWPEDEESVALLAEYFGYVISSATDLQKILFLLGPTRAGKGLIARILTALVGRPNVAGPTLASLGQNFGLAPLIGKPLAIIADARLGNANQNIVVERLLSISGEDLLTIDRKYKEPWSGTLGSRLVLLSNELPRFKDSSGALANRFVILRLTESWLGREDLDLPERLLRELPGILNWALAGLDSLRKQGHFTVPATSTDDAAALADMASPTRAFIREYCKVGPDRTVEIQVLFRAWRTWCDDNGHQPGSVQVFGRDLRSVHPGIGVAQPREDGVQVRTYQGIGLREST